MSEESKKMLLLKPGDWVDLGEYETKKMYLYRSRLKYLRECGAVRGNVKLLHNDDNRILALHLPDRAKKMKP